MKQRSFLTLVFGVGLLLGACRAAPDLQPAAGPEPAPAQVEEAPNARTNIQTLDSARLVLDRVDFGLAPLLLNEEARIELISTAEDQIARLVYPQQPADPRAWSTTDALIAACAVQRALREDSQISWLRVGAIKVPASVDNEAEEIDHLFVWITFSDGSKAIVDRTPLSTNFAARHNAANRMTLYDESHIEPIFADRRHGVNLNQLQPMLVVENESQPYYLLARVMISKDTYEFSLQAHPVEIADSSHPLSLRPGAISRVTVQQSEFRTLQARAADSGPNFFAQNPELVTRLGASQREMGTVLDNHLHLLWHIVTKFGPEPSHLNQPFFEPH